MEELLVIYLLVGVLLYVTMVALSFVTQKPSKMHGKRIGVMRRAIRGANFQTSCVLSDSIAWCCLYFDTDGRDGHGLLGVLNKWTNCNGE